MRFEVNGRPIEPASHAAPERAPLEVRIERQRKASGLGHIERHAQPVAESLRGIAISTYAKVIRRGWDWLGILPAAPERITGIIEVPALARLGGEVLLALYRRRGAVINSGIGRHGYTYLLGPEANKFVFAKADAFSWGETFESLALVDGPTALIVSDGDDHRRRRSVVAPGLRHRQIQDYVQTMVSNIDTIIDGWRRGQRLERGVGHTISTP